MNVKLYVGNVPYTATEEELHAHFAQAGTVVSAIIVMDRYTGRSRGFGFVEMSTQEEAENAIKMLDNSSMGGRDLKVNFARPREERGRRRDWSGRRDY